MRHRDTCRDVCVCVLAWGEGEWEGVKSKLYVIASAAVLDAASWTLLTYCGAI